MQLPRGIRTQHGLDPVLCAAPERHRQAQRRAPGLLEPHRRLALVAAGCAEVQRYRWSSVRAQLLSAYADAIAAKRATRT